MRYTRAYASYEGKVLASAVEKFFAPESTPQQRIRFATSLLVAGAGLYDSLALDLTVWQLLRMPSEEMRLEAIKTLIAKLASPLILEIFQVETESEFRSEAEQLNLSNIPEKDREKSRKLAEKVLRQLMKDILNIGDWPDELKNAWSPNLRAKCWR